MNADPRPQTLPPQGYSGKLTLAAIGAAKGGMRVEPGSIRPKVPLFVNNLGDHKTGRKLGEYQLGLVLGKGAFGKVYRAKGPKGSVAIKEILKRALDAKNREAVLREAELLTKLDHPHIVKVIDAFETNKCFYHVLGE